MSNGCTVPELVAARGEECQVPRERRRIAREIPEIRHAGFGDRGQRRLVAALARRVEEHDFGLGQRAFAVGVRDRPFDATLHEPHASLDRVACRVRTGLGDGGDSLRCRPRPRRPSRRRLRTSRPRSRGRRSCFPRVPLVRDSGRSPDHLAVDLEERRRRNAVADAFDRLLHVVLTPDVGHRAAEHGVGGARFVRIRDPHDPECAPRSTAPQRRSPANAVRCQRDDRFTRRDAGAHDRVLHLAQCGRGLRCACGVV